MFTNVFIGFLVLVQGTLYCTSFRLRDYPEPVTEKTEQEAFEKLLKLEYNTKNLIESLIKQVLPVALRFGSEAELSGECLGSMMKMVFGLRDLKLWAVKMIDASGKPSSGIMSGNVMAHGAYHQCLETVMSDSGFSAIGAPPVTGKYCRVSGRTPLPPKSGLVEAFQPVFIHTNTTFKTELMEEMSKYFFMEYLASTKLGVCIPSTCTDLDMQQLVSLAGNKMELRLELDYCEVAVKKTFNITQIVILILLLIIPFLCCLATIIIEIAKFRFNENYTLENKIYLYRVLKCFSLVDNFQNLMQTKPSEKRSLDVINGIRYITATWVILSHCYLIINMNMLRDVLDGEKILEDMFMVPLSNGLLSVSSFFLITGTLLSYGVVKQFDTTLNFSPFKILWHRIWRMLPDVFMIMGIVFLLPNMASSPDYREIMEEQAQNCKENWWTNLFFVSNFLIVSHQCVPHAWYISADMQLFLVGLLYFTILFKNKLYGTLYLIFIILAGITSSGLVTYVLNYPPTFLFRYMDMRYMMRYFRDVHIQANSYLGAYGLGLFLGTYLARHSKVKISRWTNLIGWVVFSCTGIVVVYGIYPWNNKQWFSSVEAIAYSATNRTVWALCISWVILSCYVGKGGYVNSFLSWPGFQPLVKISYLLYITHAYVIFVHEFSKTSAQSFNHITLVFNFLAILCITHILSVVLRIFFEAPLIQVERVFCTWIAESSKGKLRNEDPKKSIEDHDTTIERNDEDSENVTKKSDKDE